MFVSEADHAGRDARALFRLEQGEEIPGFFFTEDLGDGTGATRVRTSDRLVGSMQKSTLSEYLILALSGHRLRR